MLQKQFNHFEKISGGTLGISATHIESNETISFNEDKIFLMCSTYKLPMMACLLQKVEQGKIDLNQLCEVNKNDLRPGMIGFLNHLDYSTPVQLSVLNLLRLALQESDNTSTDILLKLIGGPSVVMQTLSEINIRDMRVNRSTLEVITAVENNTFKADERDSCSPTAMMQLLTKIFNSTIIQPKYTELLFNIMRRCRTGQNRLMGLLPQGTPVAHKTGTLTSYCNDVGVITLPHNAGHIVIAVFIKDSPKDVTALERVIAEVARTIYDYFLFKSRE